MKTQIERFIWIGFILFVAIISFYLYIKFSNYNLSGQLLSLQQESCQELFQKINFVCYSGTGTSINFNFYATKYFNGLYIFNSQSYQTISKIYCSYYIYNLTQNFDCFVIYNSSIPIEYYNNGIYYTLYEGKGYEIFNLQIEKYNPTTIYINLNKP